MNQLVSLRILSIKNELFKIFFIFKYLFTITKSKWTAPLFLDCVDKCMNI